MFGKLKISKKLLDVQKANQVAEQVIGESLAPLSDRIRNLALPQRMKKDSKLMRQKIVCAILNLIVKAGSAAREHPLPCSVHSRQSLSMAAL